MPEVVPPAQGDRASRSRPGSVGGVVLQAAGTSPFAVGQDIEVAIEDSGPGVPLALRTRIFDPFFTTKPAGQGTGLGLSISAQIAARHGGTLTVEEGRGGGAKFVLRLPIAVPPMQTPTVAV